MGTLSDQKDASEGKENGPAADKREDKPSKPQKPSKLKTDEDGKPSMENVDMDQFREAAIKAGYEDVANYYAKKTDGNASFLRAARAGNLDKVLEYLKGSTDINTSNANGLNALHLSSKEGHLNIVTELLKRGANVNAATKKGNTALHIGALAGQEEIVKVLIEHGADVNVQSQNGFTPLYMAAQENHTGVVKYLLSNKADQNLATEDGFTPLAVALQQGHDKVVAVLLENDRAGKTRLPALHIAARKDDTKAAALLLQSGHDPDVTSKSGFTPLHIAAHYGHVNVATLLLQKGATVDYSARNHITPLHVAAKWGKVNMVNTLLDRGAKIDAKTRDGLTPLHCSARSGHDHCVDQLLERGAPISTKTKSGLAPLHMAAQGDHVDSARLLLFHKAPVDDVTVDYLTPLHVAAHCGHHRVAKLLLDRKATADARALNGFTPLHIACKKNRIKVIELLLKYGASIHATTESGLTPLHAAAFMGNVQIVPYLIKNGAKVNETNVRGETPLHLAARSNQIDVMKILIDNGATVDARAHENQTPLHIAARLGNAEIVTLLLEKGANADAQTRDQYTALHIAAREGKEDVAAVLLDSGATLSMKTKKDFTPLHVAAKYGRLEVASLLLRNYAAPDAKAQNGLTPLHIAAHYDNVDVAMLLLDHGASPHTAAKNGFTPLHIAAKKNQMDVATTLLEYGADPNATTKHGISPVHLAALEGHSDMLSLLLERGAKPNIVSKNGLTPLHLAAQEDQLNCAVILVNSQAEIDPKTKAGYTPLHVACHYGNIKTATYLLEHDASVEEKTKHGLTPLHQGAQQGHVGIVNVLLTHKADPNEKANNGYTPLAIAKRLGYISVVNTLTNVTEETTIVTSPNDEKLKVQVPETMVVNFMSDSDDEGDDVSMTGDQSMLSPQEIRTMADDSVTARKSWQDDWMNEPNMNYFSGVGSLSGHYDRGSPGAHLSVTSPSGYSTLDSRYGDRSINGDSTLVDGEAPIQMSSELIVESAAPMDHSTPARLSSRESDNEGPRSIPSFHGFLISFIVDARGGTMRSKRLPGMRLVVPPKRASGPTRVTCRLIKRTKLQTPPPLVENEALSTRVIEVGPSNTQFLGGLGNKLVTYPPLNDGETMVSRILEMGPSGEKFLRPVLLEVPHFASLRGTEREIVVLRSDNGESWKEHSLGATEEEVKKAMEGFELEDNVQSDRNVCRIITKDFPQYFAIISRVRQETNIIGTQGGMLSSSVVPQVQAVFPEGTLTKKIKVGLQAQPVSNETVKKVLGNRVMVSPIVTIEPRRRKFHKPITVTIPVPTAYNQGVNNYGGDTPTLRLLCSISGGTAPAQWEDITGTTPLTFVNDCVSFTTTVSARFWLMDCKEIDQASNFARELYQELKAVPFMSKFVVFAKTHDPIEARVRVFCVTEDKIDRPLEQKEEFKEVARSKDVEVMDGRPVYIEMAGNLVPVQKSGEQLHLNFRAFNENRLPFFVRVRDQTQDSCGRVSFMREPRVQRGLPPQVPVCNLNVTMPPYVKVKKATDSESESESESEDEREQYQQDILLSNLNFDYIKDKKHYTFPAESERGPGDNDKPEVILWDVANKLGSDWPALGRQLGSNDRELKLIENENDDIPEQAFVVLHLWAERQGPDASVAKLSDALQAIGRGDIVDQRLPQDKPLDVTITTRAYSPLRADSPRDRHTDITIDITGPPVDETLDAPSRKGPEESVSERMDPVQVQELADLLNEVDEEASPDQRPDKPEDQGPHVEEEDMSPSHQAAVQSESPKLRMTPEDEKEIQELWDMDWPQPGEKPLSANLAERVESAPPSQQQESAPPSQQGSSGPTPVGVSISLESAPRDHSAPPSGDGGKLHINFDPNAGVPTGYKFDEDRERELQELWSAETGPDDERRAREKQDEEDDGPTVQENMAPGKLPPASAQRKVTLTPDDEKELQDFWDNPPAEPQEPEYAAAPPAASEESAAPAPREESAPPPRTPDPEESAPPQDMPDQSEELTPRPQDNQETESAPPPQTTFTEESSPPQGTSDLESPPPPPEGQDDDESTPSGGKLELHFDPNAGVPTGYEMNPDREREVQELWEAETGPEDHSAPPDVQGDDSPTVVEDMTPGKLPPASAPDRRFELTDDDKEELQEFWEKPPALQEEPQWSGNDAPSEESAPPPQTSLPVESAPGTDEPSEPGKIAPEPEEYAPGDFESADYKPDESATEPEEYEPEPSDLSPEPEQSSPDPYGATEPEPSELAPKSEEPSPAEPFDSTDLEPSELAPKPEESGPEPQDSTELEPTDLVPDPEKSYPESFGLREPEPSDLAPEPEQSSPEPHGTTEAEPSELARKPQESSPEYVGLTEPESGPGDIESPPRPGDGPGQDGPRTLGITFNTGPQEGPSGFRMDPEREREIQELWATDVGPTEESAPPPDSEDTGPSVQEDVAPQGPTTTELAPRRFQLNEDDERELQHFWVEPPLEPREPREVTQTNNNSLESAPVVDLQAGGDAQLGDDVTEEVEVEEFEEELPDGTIRKVIRKRIKRSTIQMVPIEVDPADLPPGATHNIVVHKKVTKNTVVKDGEEVGTSENVETEIEQDGIVTEAAELRDDLQQLVDQFLADGTVEGAQVISDEQQVIDESDI